MEAAKDQVLNWALYGDSVEKIGFLKAFLKCLSCEAIHHVKNIACKAAGRKIAKQITWIGERPPPFSRPSSEVSRKGEVANQSEAKSSAEIPVFREFKSNEIIAFDIEKVGLKGIKGVNRVKAGTVSVTNFDYSQKGWMVKWAKGSFDVNYWTRAVNGFEEDSLVSGLPPEQVTAEFKEFVGSKLLVGVALENDLRSLNLDPIKL